MAGVEKDFAGEAFPAEGTRVGFLPQEPRLDPTKNVLGNVEEAVAKTRGLLKRFEELNEKLAEELSEAESEKVMAEYQRVQDAIEAANAWELDRQLEIAMDALRLPPPDADVTKLSGGEKRRVALCQLLLEQPDLLLLDEPTNHLDAESVAWLERHLAEYPGHGRRGHARPLLPRQRRGLDPGARPRRRHPVEGQLLELARAEGAAPRARGEGGDRQAPHAPARARVGPDVAARPPGQEQGPHRPLRGAARGRGPREARRDAGALHPAGPRLGDVVVRAEGVRKAYGDRLLMEDLSFDLPRGGIVGVIGPNGAGKTTLFKMIMGQEKPDAGKLAVGETVVPSYVDQDRDRPDPAKTVHDEISGGQEKIVLGKREIPSRAYVAMFNFKGAGPAEAGRRPLGRRDEPPAPGAHARRSGGNVLLLDEPTNDLDVDTLRALEEALLDFGGCAVVISHDRWFLDRIATHILAFEGDSQTVWFEGNYQDYEADRKRRLGIDADQPHRIKYKRLAVG